MSIFARGSTCLRWRIPAREIKRLGQKCADDSLTSLQFRNGGAQPRGALPNSVFQSDALIVQEQVRAAGLEKIAYSQ